MLQDKINKIIPFIESDFITYPLWEEGKYIPFIKFWKKVEVPSMKDKVISSLKELEEKNKGYKIELVDETYESTIYVFQIYPDFNEGENILGYEMVKPDWSIEEMIEILIKFFNKDEKPDL